MGAVVLLSGGLDSAVGLAWAVRQGGGAALALTFDYGQRAARREAEAAAALAGHFGIKQRLLRLDFLAGITHTALVNTEEKIPEQALEELEAERAEQTAQVWVPNRNGLFLNIATAFAESMGLQNIVAGFNAEEGAAFPDNSAAFVQAANQTFRYSTLNGVQVACPTLHLDKKGIVRMGRELGVPLHMVWSCYYGGREMCGRCESCRRLQRAMGDC